MENTAVKRNPLTNTVLIVLVFMMLFSVPVFANSEGRDKKSYVNSKNNAVILVGDSRVWHMSLFGSSSAKADFYMIYANGRGIYDLKNNYDGFMTDFKSAMKKYPSAPVVLMLGVNQNTAKSDEGRLQFYDSLIGSSAYGGHLFIVSTVGKTVGAGGSYSNSRVQAFNQKIRDHFANRDNVRVYDLYAFVDGKVTKRGDTRNGDGIHYTKEIYTQILKNLRGFVNANRQPVQNTYSVEDERNRISAQISSLTQQLSDLQIAYQNAVSGAQNAQQKANTYKKKGKTAKAKEYRTIAKQYNTQAAALSQNINEITIMIDHLRNTMP